MRYSVDVFGDLAEPRYDATGGFPSVLDPIYDEVDEYIRSKFGQDTICARSGGEWGANVRELLGSSNTRPNSVIEIHMYWDVAGQKYRTMDYLPQLQDLGYNILVGEFGNFRDESQAIKYNRRLLPFMHEHAISFAYYAVYTEANQQFMLTSSSGELTEQGKEVASYFVVPNYLAP